MAAVPVEVAGFFAVVVGAADPGVGEALDEGAGAEVDLAGDAVTMPEAAAAISELVGNTVTFVPIPIEAVRANSEDMALMLEWFDRVGYSANIAALDEKWGIRPLTLAQWIRSQKK